MSTVSISRKAMALCASFALAFVMLAGFVTANPAQAETVTKKGATVMDVQIDQMFTLNGTKYALVSEQEKNLPGYDDYWNTFADWYVVRLVKLDVARNALVDVGYPLDFISGTSPANIAECFKIKMIRLSSGKLYVAAMRDDLNRWCVFNPTKQWLYDCDFEDGVATEMFDLTEGYNGSGKLVSFSASGNYIYGSYTHKNPDYFGTSVMKFKNTFKYNTSTKKLARTTSKIRPLSSGTTTWRTVKCTVKAYTTSTGFKKKFTVKAGSKVQVKKIYAKSYSTTRYYVKNKSGSYGWINCPDLEEHD